MNWMAKNSLTKQTTKSKAAVERQREREHFDRIQLDLRHDQTVSKPLTMNDLQNDPSFHLLFSHAQTNRHVSESQRKQASLDLPNLDLMMIGDIPPMMIHKSQNHRVFAPSSSDRMSQGFEKSIGTWSCTEEIRSIVSTNAAWEGLEKKMEKVIMEAVHPLTEEAVQLGKDEEKTASSESPITWDPTENSTKESTSIKTNITLTKTPLLVELDTNHPHLETQSTGTAYFTVVPDNQSALPFSKVLAARCNKSYDSDQEDEAISQRRIIRSTKTIQFMRRQLNQQGRKIKRLEVFLFRELKKRN